MKKNNLKLIAAICFTGILASCSKEKLDRFPYDSIELSQSFKTVKDAKSWDNGLYAFLRGRVYGSYTVYTDVQADQLNASLEYGNRNGSPHRWGSSFLSDDQTIGPIWQNYYNAINNLNIAIAGYPGIVATTPQDISDMNKYKGDAFLLRAYYYDQLMLRWAKAYEPSSAATDLGVPLVLKYDPNALPPRATSKAVYDQILLDIAQAKTLLAAVPGVAGSTRFTKDAATALEARVRLHIQDWAGAKTAADAVIATSTYPLINTQAEFNSMWTNDLGKEVIFQVQETAPNELGNTNSIYLGFIPTSGYYTPDFIPSQWVVDMYDNADIRKATYFAQKTLSIQGGTYPGIYLVTKYPGNPSLFTGATTNYQQKAKVFRVAELYLISAEAAVRSGAAGEAASLTTLNLLRVARGVSALSGLTGTSLFQAVKDERFRELAFEGFRLDDLKRWHEGFQRRDPQNISILNTVGGTPTLTIAADDNKFVWGIPANDITINPSLKGQQNPGW